jgi:mannose-6-phosphate isomerase-like protein (cupin superfamily)
VFNESKGARLMTAQTTGVRVVGPTDGEAGSLGAIGVRFMIDGVDVRDGGFSLVEHPMPPRALAAPLHRHSREDEYSFVLTGRMGALLGDDVVEAGPGDLVFKPRNQWHTFWNAGDEECRILEIIAPAGFEEYFREVSRRGAAGEQIGPDTLPPIAARYGLELDFESIPVLCERFGLRFIEEAPPAP